MKIENLIQELKKYSPAEIIFVGLGNEYRCDDAAGLVFFDRLRNTAYFKASHFIRAEMNPENHLQQILEIRGKVIVFIDAIFISFNKENIFFLSAKNVETLKISTHSFSLNLLEKFLLSEQKFVFKYLCIRGYNKGFGNSLSTELQISIEDFFKERS